MVENIQDIDDLKNAIQGIVVKDYGDFKRKTVLYLNRFNELHSFSGEKKKAYKEIIDRVQYHPNFDIENTRAWTLDQLNKL